MRLDGNLVPFYVPEEVLQTLQLIQLELERYVL